MANILVEQARQRFEKRPESVKTCLHINGITERHKSAMRQMFLDGKYSIAEVAKAVGVSYSTARKAIEQDDELREMWETTFQSRMDDVEQAMVERAIDSPNQIASQQAGEFLLRHRRKDIYSESAVPTDMLKALPKIIIAPIVSRSPIQPEAIEVKSE